MSLYERAGKLSQSFCSCWLISFLYKASRMTKETYPRSIGFLSGAWKVSCSTALSSRSRLWLTSSFVVWVCSRALGWESCQFCVIFFSLSRRSDTCVHKWQDQLWWGARFQLRTWWWIRYLKYCLSECLQDQSDPHWYEKADAQMTSALLNHRVSEWWCQKSNPGLIDYTLYIGFRTPNFLQIISNT